MASAIPKVPVRQPATRLEQARDKMLIALERAAVRERLLRSFPIVQSQYVQWNKDHPDYVAWLERVHIWEKVVEDMLRMPAAERGRGDSPLTKRIDTRGWDPDPNQEETIVMSTRISCPDAIYHWSEGRDLPDGEILFSDEELLSVLSHTKKIIADPPELPDFKIEWRLSWSPRIQRNVHADMLLSLSYPGAFNLIPACLNDLFEEATPACIVVNCHYTNIYIWAYPPGLSISRVTRMMNEMREASYSICWTKSRKYILTPDLTYLEQLAREKVGVIAYDPQKDSVYIPEGSY